MLNLPENIKLLAPEQKDQLLASYLELHDLLSEAIEEPEGAFQGMRESHPAIYRSIVDRLIALAGNPYALAGEPKSPKPYAQPTNAGIPSAPAPAGRRAAKLLDALDSITWAIFKEGEFTKDCHNFKIHVIERLKADGWRVSVGSNDNWKVLPPKPERKKRSA